MSGARADEAVLVTGGGGHLGTHLVEAMVAEGARPVVLDLRPGVRLKTLEAEGRITLLIHDLCAAFPGGLTDRLQGITSLVHLAALMDDTDDVIERAGASIQQNLLALIRLLQQLPRLRHLCFASSMMVYGNPVYSPMDECHPTHPQNIYGITKLAGEQYLRIYARERGVATARLRLCGVYGPGAYSPLLRNRAIPSFIRRVAGGEVPVIYGDGSERRDYVYIDDAVSAIQLARHRQADGVFNIGSGRGVSVLELARTIIEVLGARMEPHIERRATGPIGLDYTLDISKAGREIGYRPATPLREGLAQEAAWFRLTGTN